MNERDLLQLALFVAGLVVLTPLLGGFMARLFSGERTFLTPLFAPVERVIYRFSGIEAEREQTWREYLGALLLFNTLGVVVLLLLQMLQAWLPGNPAALPNVPFALALNTAISFVT